MEIVVEFNQEKYEQYCNGEPVLFVDNDNVELFFTNDKDKTYSLRKGTKKHGCYFFSEKDKQSIHSGEKTLVYHGKDQVYVIKKFDGDL